MSSNERTGYLFKWKIENFSFCYHENGHSIISPSFIAEGTDTKWYIRLYPRGSYATQRHISIFLMREELSNQNDQGNVSINCKIELLGPSGNILESLNGDNASVLPYDFIGNDEFVGINMVEQDMEANHGDTLTILIHIYSIDSKILDSKTYEACNKIQIYRETFQYNIAYTEEENTTSDVCIFSPNSVDFNIKLKRMSDQIKFVVHRENVKKVSSHFIELQIIVLTVDVSRAQSLKATHLFENEEDSNVWEFPLLFYIDNEECYVKEGCLMILIEFACSGKYIVGNTDTITVRNLWQPNTKKSITCGPTLQDDMYDIFCNEKHCDVKLQLSDGIVEVHKSVLVSRSAVFSAMFGQDMLEAKTGVVNIPDLDVCSAKLFLKFLYTDTVDDMDYETAIQLILIANQYQVTALKEKCATFLKSQLTAENACEVAKLGDAVCRDDLRELAVDFITVNSKTILTKPEWVLWMKNNMELATEIFLKLTKKVTLT